MMAASPRRGRISAVLGPTNTGKTHLAIERMLGHASGMIGFPLRLLARENYDRIVKLRGPGAVALVTGEEKIVPPRPSYFVCTVESMPLDRPVAFLAVDEIQLAADPERGHVFTDRLLHARGLSETMFLGAATVRGLLRRLVPEAEIVSRPRFSRLAYAGPRKVTRLPPRSAAIAFSAAEVYRVAELLRRQRGGVAVVLGALSPRTRNAQVGMYQAGEVDYLVATDAIGMGLNMDLDHIAFTRLRKFDGRGWRDLAAAELAQIAGRAGRHMSDGTFGTTSELGPLAPELVEAIESHMFDPVRTVNWRSGALDFSSVAALRASLAAPPTLAGLVRACEADDQRALALLGDRAEIADRARGPAAVRLLWDVCQIPDFGNATSGGHSQLLAQVFRHLTGPEARLPTDWVARQIDRLDRTGGDIDALMARIAHVRTWTYMSHRADWVDDAAHWQGRARALEDRLSDALHERLLQRFVDRRAATLVRRLRDGGNLAAVIRADEDGADEVLVESQYVGRLAGFCFRSDPAAIGADARPVLAAANRALRAKMPARIARFLAAQDDAFDWRDDGNVVWRGVPVARLMPGRHPLAPRLALLADDFVDGTQRARLHRRLVEWLAARLRADLAPLYRLRADETGAAPEIGGPARGLLYQLGEGLGSVPRAEVDGQVRALTEADRAALARLGVRLGMETVYMPALLKAAAIRLRTLLWAVQAGLPPPDPPPAGRVSFAIDPRNPPAHLDAIGFRALGSLALRVDMVERVAASARRLAREGPFRPTAEMMSLAGCGAEDLAAVLTALGFAARRDDDGPLFEAKARRRGRPSGPARRPAAGDSPFAALAVLRENG